MAQKAFWEQASCLHRISRGFRIEAQQQFRSYASLNTGINRGLRVTRSRESRPHDGQNPDKQPVPDPEWRHPDRRRNGTATDRSRADSFKQFSPVARGFREPFAVPYTAANSHFVLGYRAVKAVLAAGRRKVFKLYHGDLSPYQQGLLRRAKERGAEVTSRDKNYLDSLAYAVRKLSALKVGRDSYEIVHDDIILECSPLDTINLEKNGHLGYIDMHSMQFEASSPTSRSRFTPVTPIKFSGPKATPFLVWLSGVQNTENAGAIIRSATYFGADAIIMSGRGSSGMTPSFLRQSAGSAEFVPIIVCEDPRSFVSLSKKTGHWKFLAATPTPSISKLLDLDSSCVSSAEEVGHVLCLGNEARGLEPWLMEQADAHVTIRKPSLLAEEAGVESLNVSVAAGILCEKLLREAALSNTATISPSVEQDVQKTGAKRLF